MLPKINVKQSMWVFLLMFPITLAVPLSEEQEAKQWLEELEWKHNKICNQATVAAWKMSTNITQETRKAAMDAEIVMRDFLRGLQTEVHSKFRNWKQYKDQRLRRAFKFLSVSGPGDMPKQKLLQMSRILDEMSTAYSTATVCNYRNRSSCDTLKLEDLQKILQTSNDVKEMEHYFIAWHDKMSELVPPQKFAEFIHLQNEEARYNGFNSTTDMWNSAYEEPTENISITDFEKMVLELEQNTAKLYEVLHAYVRMKLRKIAEYNKMIDKCGYIPVHITGDMWGQQWDRLYNFTEPFPNTATLDCTSQLQKKEFTPLKMFQLSDEFLKGLGLKGMFPEFYKNSMLERPTDGRETVCHASAEDMCLGKGNTDFRIIQCTEISQKHLYFVHHEMGHVEYFQHYTDLEFPFRSGANPGFHEAIGDSLVLAVLTPQHLQCALKLDLGLPDDFCDRKEGPFNVTETDINFLYQMALTKLAIGPSAVAFEFWRWHVFEGRIKPEQFSKRWWDIRKTFQGLAPPQNRDAPNLFDPGAKFHITADVEYMRYFVANVLLFQFYEAMCIASGQFKPKDPLSRPLYQCDFSGSKEAGTKLANMLKMGKSQPWPEPLEAMTGSRKMSVEPMKNYFKPLLEHMEKELMESGEVIGFGESCEAVEKAKAQPQRSTDELWESLRKGTLF